MIFICGNGGSATQANHFAGELVPDGIPCISLCANVATLTAIANDYGYEMVFARQLDALAKPGDLLIALSTSGESRNVRWACIRAKAIGMDVVLITSERLGRFDFADIVFRLPGNTQEIQEATLMILHEIWKGVAE